MAVRYYLSTVTGSGTQANPFRPATTTVRPNDYTADDGRPNDQVATGRMLVRIDVTPAEHAQLVALAGVTAIPFEDVNGTPLSLSDPISLIPAATRTALRNALEAQHIDTDDLQLSDPIGLVLLRIKRRFKLRNVILRALDFVEGLDTTIGQIPVLRRTNINAALQAAGFDTTGILNSDTIREALRKLWQQNRRAILTDAG